MFENFTSFTGFLRAKIGIFLDFNNPYQKSIIDPLYSSITAVHFVLDLILWPLKNLIVAARAPKISLGQKYLTTSTLYDPSYNTLDLHRDLKKLTGSNVYAHFYGSVRNILLHFNRDHFMGDLFTSSPCKYFFKTRIGLGKQKIGQSIVV